MAEKTILPFGDPVLRKKAKPVEEVNSRIIKLLDDMVDTLYAAEGRAGLAAPQIGFLRRVVVMDCGDGLIELINPVMLEMSGEQIGTEGCLSLPGHSGIVKRANQVKISSLNRQGETFVLEAEGYLARCIQHEMDHLDGVLYIDKIEGNVLIHDETGRKVNVFDIIRLSKPEH
ncbi:peptide deformylase [Paenibacillus tianmuensis]|uniref:Peptide deformylase n=1 Tax=Paenibacillus tianmuensis TaxID=624147 RepID=A0A1G4QAI4_9BACL|nr:peptide deformylase [Paenibacillus tianmuensis]SCW41623.1 peptide deformylase [Paenibacillus tianmuensis]